MPPNDYLRRIIASKKSPSINLNDWRLLTIKSALVEWAGQYLSELKQSGSSAKGTAVHGIADFDIFISLKSDTPETLKEAYNKLDTFIQGKGYTTRRQNVSIGITANSLEIDLVPGKIQSGYQNYHSIYLRKKDSWMQTNVDLHINKVVNSQRQEEIILTKIWRKIHSLDSPSIYLELTVLEAVKNRASGDVSSNFWKVLEYLRDSFVDATVYDPSNTNNKISDLLTTSEKEKIAVQAKSSLKEQYWEQIIW
jgi:Second Messenger Oligonucleotide or Dinucleotide Synthetase domain